MSVGFNRKAGQHNKERRMRDRIDRARKALLARRRDAQGKRDFLAAMRERYGDQLHAAN